MHGYTVNESAVGKMFYGHTAVDVTGKIYIHGPRDSRLSTNRDPVENTHGLFNYFHALCKYVY